MPRLTPRATFHLLDLPGPNLERPGGARAATSGSESLRRSEDGVPVQAGPPGPIYVFKSRKRMATITGNSRGWGALAHTDHHSSSRLTKSIQPGPAGPSRSLAVPSIGSPVRADECTRAITISAPGLQLTRGPTPSKSDGPSRLRVPLPRPRGWRLSRHVHSDSLGRPCVPTDQNCRGARS